MELSESDNLRLNVLLTQELQAVRIDESRMTVHALSDRGEARVELNPNCRDDLYLRRVRELLSTRALGSPGGYPVFLRRWTRMGQARDDSLQRLLLLGEPEAVVAVVHAQGLTDDLARRAWWADPCSENARRMLERGCVATGSMGPELAEFLLDYLPFEDQHGHMIDTVRLVLQPGLLDEAQRAELWARGRRRNSYLVGFLAALPDELPASSSAHPRLQGDAGALHTLAESGNALAALLARVWSAPGQAYLDTALTVMKKPADQDVVVALLETLGRYFAAARPSEERFRAMEPALAAVDAALQAPATGSPPHELLETLPETRDSLRSLMLLSMAGESLVDPIFGLSDAIGTVMRRRIEPVTGPLSEQLAALRAG